MEKVNIVSENMDSTVVTNYEYKNSNNKNYQSEAELEKEFIKTLQEQSYEYLKIKSEAELIANLRIQLEKLNKYKFTDKEWSDFYNKVISNSNNGILEKTRLIQEDYIQTITMEYGSKRNIYLIDKDNIHNNSLQVINQYEADGTYHNRYDVTVLVNGLPMVHIELKKRGIDLREAFNQINRYQRDSFWSGSGLFEYVQIFVISNGTITKYYSNTTRDLHVKGTNKKTSNTFEFTSYWADQKNNSILDLLDFAKTFFSKHSILNILTKYCVFTSEQNLLVMRPYQIVATEKILNRIEIAHNYKFYGTLKAGGYIWHTTGSGKTLTSFKTSILASKLDYIDKVIFVVDRKDLDYQTMKEYDRFKKGAANSNVSTKILERQLKDDSSRIIITTIQKLHNYIKKNIVNDIYDKQIVFMFDECHRSQFGNMHNDIIKKFKKYYLFGFTGTPIFAKNVGNSLQTTEQIFGDRLHTYTIVNAINDKNVLPFKYEYIQTMKTKNEIEDEKVSAIDKEKALMNPERISNIVNYVIEHYAIKTKTNESYVYSTLDNVEEIAKNNKLKEVNSKKNINGFNSIFAVASIDLSKMYYEAFKNNKNHNLKIALIYSYSVNEEDNNIEFDGVEEENSESTEKLSKNDRNFLEYAIQDYNKMFGTSYDTSSEKFQNYYKDVSLRMKNKEIDILIVVNMFLTGFDAKTLNTLWVDKNLKYHGLIQSFSRTNRILNSVKTFGNIVCFRNLEKELNDALSLFGDNEATGVVLIRKYEDYYNGYKDGSKLFEGYKNLVEKIEEKYPLGILPQREKNQKDFVKLFSKILKVVNILSTFDRFKNEKLLQERDMQDYSSMYIELYNNFKNQKNGEKTNIIDDIVFEMELIKQIEVNIDYILNLINKYHDENMQNKEIILSVNKAIMASPDLRNKKDLIEQFINSLNESSDVYSDFGSFMNSRKKEELDDIIKDENLNKAKTYKFIKNSFDNGNIETSGTEIAEILPPISMFTVNNERANKKNKVIEKLLNFFNRFFNITNNSICYNEFNNIENEEYKKVAEDSIEYKA